LAHREATHQARLPAVAEAELERVLLCDLVDRLEDGDAHSRAFDILVDELTRLDIESDCRRARDRARDSWGDDQMSRRHAHARERWVWASAVRVRQSFFSESVRPRGKPEGMVP